MLITTIASLYSIRLVLNILGAEDYGIFSLVAGVVAMFSFLHSAMAVSTQRYLSYYLGANDFNKLKIIFVSSVWIHLFIGLVVFILLEIAGIYRFNGILKIPSNRLEIAKWVFHFMTISTFFTINAVPYDAALIAHENLFFYSVVDIFEGIMRLGIAVWLQYINFDKLLFFGFSMVILTILVRIIKSIFCLLKYEECKFKDRKKIDFLVIKEMFSFASWNLFGILCSIGRKFKE